MCYRPNPWFALLHFSGVFDEYVQTFVGERVVEQPLDCLKRACSHVGSYFQTADYVVGMANGSGKNLCLESVCAVHFHYLRDYRYAVLAYVVEPPDEGADECCPGFCGQ